MPRDVDVAASRRTAVMLMMLSMGSAGCSGGGPSATAARSIVPDSAAARLALGRAMAAWREGRPDGMLDDEAPRVQVVDSSREPGRRLERFEILGESATPRVRVFDVRLHLAGTDARPLARYLLVGIDPILVFHRDDYERLGHFEHRMDPEPRGGARR